MEKYIWGSTLCVPVCMSFGTDSGEIYILYHREMIDHNVSLGTSQVRELRLKLR